MATPMQKNSSGEGLGTGEVHSLADIDVGTMGRLLKMLERSVVKGEDLDPFAGPPASSSTVSETAPRASASVSPSKRSIGKAKGKKAKAVASGTKRSSRSRSRSRSRQDGEASDADEDSPMQNGNDGATGGDIGEEELEKLEWSLSIARESVLAATCVIALLAADSLHKQLYSEELIRACVTTVKTQLEKIVYPFAEGLTDLHGQNSAILDYTLRSTSSHSQSHRARIGELFQALTASFPPINALVRRSTSTSLSKNATTLSDAITIQTVYVAIGPFFVVESSAGASGKKGEKTNVVLTTLGGVAAMRGLRLSALSLIRSVSLFESS